MISVIIATYNGAKTLGKVFDRLAKLQPMDEVWELIVVDNASSDETPKIIKNYSDRLPIIHLTEPRRGKNFANNTAVDRASGSLFVFIDDDILVECDFLRRIDAIASAHPEVSVFGATVAPHYLADPPEWFDRLVDKVVVLGLSDPGNLGGRTSPACILGGAMAIRAAIFTAGHRFNVMVGPDGSQTYLMGSESELLYRLEAIGTQFWICNDIIVGHVIRPHQFDRNWVLGRAYRFGRGQYRIHESKKAPNPRRVFGVPGYLCTNIVILLGKLTINILRQNHDEAFRSRWHLNLALGQAHEARQVYRQSQIHKN